MADRARSALRLATALIAACGLAGAGGAAHAGEWVAAWYSPPFPTTPVWEPNQVRIFDHQTTRQVVRLEVAGDRVRVHLTNVLGLLPVRVGDVRLALSSPNGVLHPDTGPIQAAPLIGAYRDLISRAHARGLKIYLGTLTPYVGASYERPAGEKVRQEVNAWIRKGGGFDGVIDFDEALRDPAHPASISGADQCGDDLHPNDTGYRVMAETVLDRLFATGAGP